MKGNRPRIAVVGSSNSDLVVRASRLPQPGETILGGEFAWHPGGKGANQAVAAARLGADVAFVARIGRDQFGERAMAGFRAEGVCTDFVTTDSGAPSGVALIGIDSSTGENAILVAPGANSRLSEGDVDAAAEAIRAADVLICQLETPLAAVAAALAIARDAGIVTILNPAPAANLPETILRNVSVLTPNQSEAALLAGQPTLSPALAAALLRKRGVDSVVLTLGAAGALVSDSSGEYFIRPVAARSVVDTTAAGDCFTAALAVALAEGRALGDAAYFANAAASLSVEREGAQPSLPTRAEVDQRLRNVPDRSNGLGED